VLYRPFGEHSVGVGELLRFSFKDARPDLLVMLLYGLLGGLLALALPLITAPLFNEIIPARAAAPHSTASICRTVGVFTVRRACLGISGGAVAGASGLTWSPGGRG
jgi:hypothetical protein